MTKFQRRSNTSVGGSHSPGMLSSDAIADRQNTRSSLPSTVDDNCSRNYTAVLRSRDQSATANVFYCYGCFGSAFTITDLGLEINRSFYAAPNRWSHTKMRAADLCIQ